MVWKGVDRRWCFVCIEKVMLILCKAEYCFGWKTSFLAGAMSSVFGEESLFPPCFFLSGGGGVQTVLDKRADSNHLLALFHEATQIEWFGSCCSTGIKDANWKNHMFFDSLSFSGVFGGILFVVYTSVQYSSLSSQKRDDQKANYPESRESIREWFVLRFCVDGSVEFVVFFVLGCGIS